jgi:hypothetical protein
VWIVDTKFIHGSKNYCSLLRKKQKSLFFLSKIAIYGTYPRLPERTSILQYRKAILKREHPAL